MHIEVVYSGFRLLYKIAAAALADTCHFRNDLLWETTAHKAEVYCHKKSLTALR